ncbi:MAG: hypothetical protein WCD76_21585 [Pyrinomonadaceae bacterium]
MKDYQNPKSEASSHRDTERGAALAMAMLVMTLIAVVVMSVLAVVSNEARISGSDLQRTQTCYAASAGIEKMTSDFSALFSRTSNPTQSQLDAIRTSYPALTSEGFSFNTPQPTLALDTARLTELRALQGITTTALPRTRIASGPFAGLSASVAPYNLSETATMTGTNTQCRLERTINNYLIPLFQFGMFSDEDIELHPGAKFTFNGRVHANGNVYVSGVVTFLDKVTAANEFIRDVMRNGLTHTSTVTMNVGGIDVTMTKGSFNNGPNLPGAAAGARGYFPGSPDGTINTSWDTTSIATAVSGTPDQYGGQLLTRSTGASKLLLPLQLGGNPTREIIKRKLSTDDSVLGSSRYQSKASIRIMLDDVCTVGPCAANDAGIPAGRGVDLSTFVPTRLGRLVLHRYSDAGSDLGGDIRQLAQAANAPAWNRVADAVRKPGNSVNATATVAGIAGGAPLAGRILIEVVPPSTTANPSPAPIDVTQAVLSMGITEGEPNAMLYLQRPLWMAFTQGSKDATATTANDYLTYILNDTTKYKAVTGEINVSASTPDTNSTYGFLTDLQDQSGGTAATDRDPAPPAAPPATATNPTTYWNSIVPINVYNVREGRINTGLAANAVYERGITSVVELNMHNIARWVDGFYDTTLLNGTTAVSANIDGDDGFIVYVSDRRGDRIKSERIGAATLSTTNGMADNEDIFGPNNALDSGEDVIDAGADGSGTAKKNTLQRDTAELPDPAVYSNLGATATERITRALNVATWTNPSNYFRRAVRLFNGEDLQVSGATGKLSQTKGITVATENMVYIWGNYNTTGVNCQPTVGSTLNIPTEPCHYNGEQVPASIVADAFTPLSKTWFDSSTSLYPEDTNKRIADINLNTSSSQTIATMTSVRAGIIAGNNLSALAGAPDAGDPAESHLSGGIHNFPRFLELWGSNLNSDNRSWNYVGALIPLYHSTQAMGPYNSVSSIYGAPIRNWAFDDSFRDPTRLPPGTPLFQYIQPTGFRQVL